MPIKFRCSHCRQFLGISRSKAGEVVDCPTCGRSVRVPQLDGRVEPIPEPALDFDDSRLAQALDELALIGRPVEEEPGRPGRDALPADPHAPAPLPAPAPISLDPPAPAEAQPVTLPEPPASSPARGDRKSAAPPSRRPVVPTDDPLLSLPQPPHSPPAQSRRPSPIGPSRRFAPFAAALVVGAALAGFGLGFWAGRTTSGVRTTAGPGEIRPAGNGEEPPAAGEDRPTASLKGRITYRTEAGDSKPDRAARILVFPQQRSGQAKLSIVGFRSTDPADEDWRLAAAGLRALGGDAALADDDGRFEIVLPKAGSYDVLVLSHHRPRNEQMSLEPRLKTLLDNYFDRGEQLLGRVDYHFSSIRHKATGTEPWDHTFRNPLQ